MRRGKSGVWLRRLIQTLSLLLFLWLLWRTAFPLAEALPPPDLFLRLDPLAAVNTPLAARAWFEWTLLGKIWPGLLVLALTVLFGRVFCAYMCPMGATLDLAHMAGKALCGKGGRPLSASADEASLFTRLRKVKFIVLAVILGAAAAGLNLAWWGSPIPLITRFYALLIHPVLLLTGGESLVLLQPTFSAFDLTGLEYVQIGSRRFSTMYFLLLFFGLLFLLEQVRPRFWCRCLCPAGALLALFGRMPLWRRRVHACVGCGTCVRNCPTGAIAETYIDTAHGECVACRACVTVCPMRGVAFSFRADEKAASVAAGTPAQTAQTVQTAANRPDAACLPTRRAFMSAACGGALLAAVGFSSASSLLRSAGRGVLWPERCIRPPGSLPESAFLARCLRCGACMKVCPTNALQPAWLEIGMEGMFSPLLVARRGPCEPECNACGLVCPTGAIQALSLPEKQWAKTGTAVVQPEKCLAFAENRRCVVCQEVCPYGSIRLAQPAGSMDPAPVPRPVVDAARCFGCGYCENHCPVRIPAITVLPLNALRLSGANYRETGRNSGLRLELTPPPGEYGTDSQPTDGLPPGFTE